MNKCTFCHVPPHPMIQRPRLFTDLVFPSLGEHAGESQRGRWIDEMVRNVIRCAADILITQDREVLRKQLTDDVVSALEQAIDAAVATRREELESNLRVWLNPDGFHTLPGDPWHTLEDVVEETRKTLRGWNKNDPFKEHSIIFVTFPPQN